MPKKICLNHLINRAGKQVNNLLAAALPASALHVIDCTAAWKINLNSPLTTITKDDIQQAIQAGFIEKEV